MEYSLIAYMAITNVITFILYGVDKLKAKTHKWRIKESTLLAFAAIGGSVGALAGMLVFHHKTRKPKFYIITPLLLILHALLIWRFL